MSSIPTPPPTTLSTPSPTEREAPIMPPIRPTQPIYLIVATSLSPPLGIGLRNNLPWPPIKSDMSFFQRVTRDSRPPTTNPGQGSINAVIMGRKTYDSIPAKFRPLSGRLNIIISRSPLHVLAERIIHDIQKAKGAVMHLSPLATETSDPSSLILSPSSTSSSPSQSPILLSTSLETALLAIHHQPLTSPLPPIGNTFIIGGTQIYQSTLSLTSLPIRILQTQLRRLDGGAFECDTFFPINLDLDAQAQISNEAMRLEPVTANEVSSWLLNASGEAISLPQGTSSSEWTTDENSGVEIKVVGWEKNPKG